MTAVIRQCTASDIQRAFEFAHSIDQTVASQSVLEDSTIWLAEDRSDIVGCLAMRLDPRQPSPTARILFLVTKARFASPEWEAGAASLLLAAAEEWGRQGVRRGEAVLATNRAWSDLGRKLGFAESHPIDGMSVFSVGIDDQLRSSLTTVRGS